MGDKLVIGLTMDAWVNKGPRRPVNTWFDRAYVLEAIRGVDLVIPCASAMEAIQAIKPAIFVKGIDYADGGKWTEDVQTACDAVGAVIRFTTSPKRSATDTIKRVYELANHG